MVLKHVSMNFQELANRVTAETGVQIDLNTINVQNPVEMNSTIRSELMAAADLSGISAMDMPSGAGHDVQQFGGIGGLIFIRHGNNGASHRPDELLGRAADEDPFLIGSDFAHAVVLNRHWLKGSNPLKNKEKISFTDDLIARGARVITAPR
jgi:hypothetical protein